MKENPISEQEMGFFYTSKRLHEIPHSFPDFPYQ